MQWIANPQNREFESHPVLHYKYLMLRILEPELMIDSDQVISYLNNDRSKPKNLFKFFYQKLLDKFDTGSIVDLGCGPGDLTVEIAQLHPNAKIDAVDASLAMLGITSPHPNVTFKNISITDISTKYDRVVSSMTLHHFHNPLNFWYSVKNINPNDVFVYDMLRPVDELTLLEVVDANGPYLDDIFRLDFENSLRASFTVDEIKDQLIACNLDLSIKEFTVEENNLKIVIISGKLK